ncbi:MAG: hypothetical protein IKR25_08270 [Muribaculaceae bacterium]|nr:hypothetical protein [Muribaculaceae bacterium]
MKQYFITLIFALLCATMVAQDRLYIEDFNIRAGETRQVALLLDNATPLSAVQADIVMPDGLSIGQNSDNSYQFALADRCAANHTLASARLSTGAVRVLTASITSQPFAGNTGAVVTFPVTAASDFSGPRVIQVTGVKATTNDAVQLGLPDTQCTVTTEVPSEDRLYIEDFTIQPGATIEVALLLDNPTQLSAIQADIILPDGLTIGQNADNSYQFALANRCAADHTLASARLSNGAVRVLTASITSQPFAGSSGAVVTFPVTAASDFSGPRVIQVTGVKATTAAAVQLDLPDTQCTVTTESAPQYLIGDINLDGNVDITDLNILINITLTLDRAENYDRRAYITDDDVIDVSDINALINIMLGL